MPSAIDQGKMDAKQNTPSSFDQTQPPLKPIAHQEYPKTLYLWAKDKTIHPLHGTAIEKDSRGEFTTVTDFSRTDQARVKIVNTPEEEAALKAKGWRDKPHTQQVIEEVPEGFDADLSHLEEEKKEPKGKK